MAEASMLERVKAAVAEEYGKWRLVLNPDDGRIVALHGDLAADLGKDRCEAEAQFQDLRETALARAAIEAMREPTPKMLAAGWAAINKGRTKPVDMAPGPALREAFPAMIDAILAEGGRDG